MRRGVSVSEDRGGSGRRRKPESLTVLPLLFKKKVAVKQKSNSLSVALPEQEGRHKYFEMHRGAATLVKRGLGAADVAVPFRSPRLPPLSLLPGANGNSVSALSQLHDETAPLWPHDTGKQLRRRLHSRLNAIRRRYLSSPRPAPEMRSFPVRSGHGDGEKARFADMTVRGKPRALPRLEALGDCRKQAHQAPPDDDALTERTLVHRSSVTDDASSPNDSTLLATSNGATLKLGDEERQKDDDSAEETSARLQDDSGLGGKL